MLEGVQMSIQMEMMRNNVLVNMQTPRAHTHAHITVFYSNGNSQDLLNWTAACIFSVNVFSAGSPRILSDDMYILYYVIASNTVGFMICNDKKCVIKGECPSLESQIFAIDLCRIEQIYQLSPPEYVSSAACVKSLDIILLLRKKKQNASSL